MRAFNTIKERIGMAALYYPDKMGAKDLNRSMTFKILNERCSCLANGLLALGLKKGDRFAAIAYDCVEWVEIYGAAAKAGLVAVPVMFRLVPEEYKYILENSGSSAFIVGTEFIEGADSIRNELPQKLRKNFIHMGSGKTPMDYISYDDLMRDELAYEPEIDVNYEDAWCIIYTSGTTGKPKGVVLTHGGCVSHFIMHALEMGFNRDDIGLLVMPMCHANSFYYCFGLIYCYAGVCIYNRKSFEVEDVLKTIDEEGASFTSLVPTQYVMILSLADKLKTKYDVSSIKKLLCSSAPVRKSTKLEIMTFFKNAKLFEGYGSTEVGVILVLRPEDQMNKLTSVGREVMGVSPVKLLDEEGKEVPVGTVGEIYSKQPSTFKEYWNAPEVTNKAFRGDFFSAGDMAYKDKDGYFYIVDRKANMIITGGENVYPSEVENVVISHPAVREVAVIGLPDEKWGESITAIVVLEDDFALSEKVEKNILEYCRGKMAGYKRPKSIEFCSYEEIPRTATGKIIYGSLRDRYGRWIDHKDE